MCIASNTIKFINKKLLCNKKRQYLLLTIKKITCTKQISVSLKIIFNFNGLIYEMTTAEGKNQQF